MSSIYNPAGSSLRFIGSLTASVSDESGGASSRILDQVKYLLDNQEQQKQRTVTALADSFAEVKQKNTDLLTDLDFLTHDLVTEILETIISDAVLQGTERKLARYELENAKLKAEIQLNQEDLDSSERTNTRLEMENSALVGYARNELLKLSAASQCQELLNQLRPPNSIEIERAVSELKGVSATLKSLEEFGALNQTLQGVLKIFNQLIKKIEAWEQQQKEASKPIDQPKLESLIDSLTLHLIRCQIKQIGELVKERNSTQIQPIIPHLKKDLGAIWNQLKALSPSEESPPQSAAPSVEKKNTGSWWAGG